METTIDEPRSKAAVAREIETNRLRLAQMLHRTPPPKASKVREIAARSKEVVADCKSKLAEKASQADEKVRSNIYPALGIAAVLGVAAGFLVKYLVDKRRRDL
jgi:ElaB/YqjD/DUF883 family membrane-anchored ribosome-binding protein